MFNLLYNNCNATRFVYNWGLGKSIDYYNKTGMLQGSTSKTKSDPSYK